MLNKNIFISDLFEHKYLSAEYVFTFFNVGNTKSYALQFSAWLKPCKCS